MKKYRNKCTNDFSTSIKVYITIFNRYYFIKINTICIKNIQVQLCNIAKNDTWVQGIWAMVYRFKYLTIIYAYNLILRTKQTCTEKKPYIVDKNTNSINKITVKIQPTNIFFN